MADSDRQPAPDADETRGPDAAARAAQAIGPYRLLEPIGEGGMGEVWLAEQAKPVRRKVALKIIKAGMNTAQVVARFEAERQALALMDHSAIARVFEAGATAEGRPYFAMEYVRGESITAYCAKHKLALRERIDLFLQVCDGVQHAHQKGVIHRDLKPSNVLVTLQDDRPVPKIIDFGVAKATTQPLTDRTLHTELGTFIGTPEYMSPEQAEMSGLDVDTRTDVYSLGAILYELLTGAMPFDSKTLREKSLDDLRRTIREVDPPRPSTRVTAAGAAPNRPPTHVEPSKLASELKGDLDWITMKALEKDRTRRYGSASDLAADLQRHLDDEPVLAGPPSTTYRVGKFVRRHRGGVAAAAVVLVLLVGFGVTMAVQARRLARERDRASRAQAAAEALSDFLRNDVLAQASLDNQSGPDVRPDPDIKVRTALDRAAVRIEGKFAAQPLVESSIRETIGATYGDLGLIDQARAQVQRSLEIARRVAGDEGPETLRALDTLAWVEGRGGNSAEALRRYTALLEIYTRRVGPKDADTIRTMNNVAWNQYLEGQPDRAEATLIGLIRLEREVLGNDDGVTLTSLNNLAAIYLERGAWKEAEPLLTEALATNRRVRGAEHPTTVLTLDRLAQVFGQQGRFTEAEAMRREVLAIKLRTAGPDEAGTGTARMNLAQNLINQDDPAKRPEAERLLAESLAIARRVSGDRSRQANTLRVNLGDLYVEQERYAEAEVMLRDAVSGLRESPGPTYPGTLNALVSLGQVYLEAHKYVDAEHVLREAVTGRVKTMPKSWRRFDAESMLGGALAGQRRFNDAEPLIVGAYEHMREQIASIPAYHRDSLTDAGQRIVELYTAWGKPSQAAEWRKKLAAQ
jgi:non-specific serine/threonine protein kinase/serine/threonine-protein kinase